MAVNEGGLLALRLSAGLGVLVEGEETMARKLTAERLRARASAYEEAAEHLELAWTDDEEERAEGDALTRAFHAECARLRAIANAREFGNPLLAPIGNGGKP